MRFEIISGEHTEVIELPDGTEYAAIKIYHPECPYDNFITVGPFLPDEMYSECHTEQRELDGGMTVTVYAYCLNGAAKALSLKGYEGLVFCDLSCGDVRLRLIV